jgi:hypothetical protein
MSTIKVDTIKNTSNVEVFTAKAWVNFNGTGSPSIRESGNVSSIVDNGTGYYTVNFTTAMTDANYSAVANATSNFTGSWNRVVTCGDSAIPTTTSIRLRTNRADTTTYDDCEYITLAIFR